MRLQFVPRRPGERIQGKVTDVSGALLPGVAITIKNTETGITRAVLTGDTGVYSAANLQPGTYQVTAEMPAFSVGMKKDIGVNVGSEVAHRFSIEAREHHRPRWMSAAEVAKVDVIASTVNRTVDGTPFANCPSTGATGFNWRRCSPAFHRLPQAEAAAATVTARS
jgi:hypothetical protein